MKEEQITNKMNEAWMGLDGDGNPVQILHVDLMAWARRNGEVFTVGWSRSYTDPKGRRLVRGDHVSEARKAGWDDLAERLEAFFLHEQDAAQ